MPEQNTFKGTPIIVSDDPDFAPDPDFNGFSMSPEDMLKMQAAGMIKTKDITNKLVKDSKKKRKARKLNKQAKKSRANNRRK